MFNIICALILLCVSVFVYWLTVYIIKTIVMCHKLKYEHIYMIKKACKLGELNKLIKNCSYLVQDYTSYYYNDDIKQFYKREYFLTHYRHTFYVSYKILRYLDNNKVYERYKKLNKKHRKSV